MILFWFFGFPSDDTFTFRWDNPFYRGDSRKAEPAEEPIIVLRPRRLRELPEMEKPQSDVVWDSRRLPFGETLGIPSPMERPFAGAAESGRNRASGDSLDFVSDKPFRGKGTYDTFGMGGGGGGRYGTKIVLKDAVQLGLLWLARHQNEDGSWSAAADRCGRALPNGREVTGPPCESESAGEVGRWSALAATAFAAAGYAPDSPDVWDGLRYSLIVSRSCRYLSRPPRDAQARALALLALSSFVRRPWSFSPPVREEDELPVRERLRELLAAVEADPPPAEGSDEAAWVGLALVSAATRAELEGSPALLQRAADELRRRLDTLPALEPESWPGEDLPRTYLRLLASYEASITRKPSLPSAKSLYPRLRAGQCRDADACREGSWEPVGKESRLSTTILHLLALESLPGYGFRGGHPTREAAPDAEDLEHLARVETLRAIHQKRVDSVLAVPGALRRGIQRVRAGAKSEEMIRKAFAPVELTYVRYVAQLEIGDHLESNNEEEFGKFKPLSRLGGKRDLITEDVFQALREKDGIVGFDEDWTLVVPAPADDLTTFGRTLIFTLPDDGTPSWKTYVVIGFPAVR
ncbi:MAG TPA: hypothetical protein VF950_27155 [Planctomycetota bacterium]